MSKDMHLEICIDSVQSALAAQAGGASRVELCDNLLVGGTTPSYGMLKQVIKAINIGVHVLIRPRGGDFCYTEAEIDVMLADIEIAKELGAAGVVIGALQPDGSIDMQVARRLIAAAGPLIVTWHRSFDLARDPKQALEQIISLGCSYLLTSGQEQSAIAGKALIAALVKQAAGRIVIMPGGGINPDNIAGLRDATGAQEFHSSGRHNLPSRMVWRRPNVYMGEWQKAEYELAVVDGEKVRAMLEAINKH